MTSRKTLGTGSAVMVIAALIAATPRFIFPVDEFSGLYTQLPNGAEEFMSCHYTMQASYLVAGLMGLIGVGLLRARSRETVRSLSGLLAGASAAIILTPTVLFPVCANPDHPCNRGSVPLLIVLGIGSFMISGWLAVTSRRPALCGNVGRTEHGSSVEAGRLS